MVSDINNSDSNYSKYFCFHPFPVSAASFSQLLQHRLFPDVPTTSTLITGSSTYSNFRVVTCFFLVLKLTEVLAEWLISIKSFLSTEIWLLFLLSLISVHLALALMHICVIGFCGHALVGFAITFCFSCISSASVAILIPWVQSSTILLYVDMQSILF